MELYMDPSQTPEERANDLITKMTLEEKITQLSGIWAYEVLSDFYFDEAKAETRIGTGIGQITRAGGSVALRPRDVAATVNLIQQWLKEHTRLGIPALVHEESCAGYLTLGADVFPQALGVGASFDPAMAEEMGMHIREQMMALGARQSLAPLMDVTRDPRWGRTEETYGEDPYLTSQMGVGYIRGLQGESLREGIIATGKHFVGYGAGEGGMNWAPAHIGSRELEEVYLYPFEAAVRAGGLRAIMPGYHELDGVPCHTNKWLLDDILRRKWGFDGLVVSDYAAIGMICTYHHAAENTDHAARMALDAGVDVELPSTDVYGEPLIRAVREGLVDEAMVDTSVLRVLRMKFALGLFEDPFVCAEMAETHFRTPEKRSFARKAAEKSMTLLKNDGVLPIGKHVRKIAVIGPNADDIRNMLGDYSYPAHVESLLDQRKDNFSDQPLSEGVYSIEDAMPAMDSVLQSLRKYQPDILFSFARGCSVQNSDESEFDEAVWIAKEADLVIAVMGDKAGLITDCTSGEARDRAHLELPGKQRKLLEAIKAAGKPMVLILVSGRPLALSWENEHMNAILEAWFPGEDGAAAITATLFGDVNPAGRLPITFPRTAGQVPIFYAHKPSGGRSHWKGEYVDESNLPLYPFGHGLSYTRFDYNDLSLDAEVMTTGIVNIEISIKNTGAMSGDEVVQLYVRDLIAGDVTRPVKELKGFCRITLSPGEAVRVRFALDTRILAFLNRAGEFVVEPGKHEVMIGASSEDIRLRGTFMLTGDTVRVTNKSFFTPSEVFPVNL